MKTPSDAGGCCGCRTAHAPLSLSPSLFGASSEDGKDGFPPDAPWEGRSTITWAPRHSVRLTAVQQTPNTRGWRAAHRASDQRPPAAGQDQQQPVAEHPLRCNCARW
ncbi:hypothetical protein AVEN_194802-1 [Araneus ventricosus]|uniref:Uncharacterized protein n=1 Tax=Araneus ventricosus TaxID=182803 RepID=A0A4Y2B656_ARAVE|nr:hypothetical protein AVEN_194802-1 [Araneus ventricosus]